MGLNQFSDLTFAEFKKLYLWSEPQVMLAGQGRRGSSVPMRGFSMICIPMRGSCSDLNTRESILQRPEPP